MKVQKRTGWYLLLAGCLLSSSVIAQQRTDPEFVKMLNGLLDFSIPTITCNEYMQMTKAAKIYLFDTRESNEFEVSHIPNARYLGYHQFNKEALTGIPKDAVIVVYCSVGYRSEKTGTRLKQMGYTNIYNLYGSIFEWVNQGNKVVDNAGKETTRIHTYNQEWSRWVKAGVKVN